MRLFLLTALVMVSFAANSLLNRVAVEGGHADPASFALVRVAAGALALAVILRLRRGAWSGLGAGRPWGAAMLSLYMVGFSLAYRVLDAGLGALILFGVVQITMFAAAALGGERPGAARLWGAGLAFAGLGLVLAPTVQGGASGLAGAAAMVAAGLGWGLYSLAGRGARDPLAVTAGNFCLALPVTALPLLIGWAVGGAGWGVVGWGGAVLSGPGLALAVISGAVTSGMGYALWYAVLPRLQASLAAVVQLSVPVIAVLGGVLFLGERVGPGFVLGAALVLGGIALGLRPGPRRG